VHAGAPLLHVQVLHPSIENTAGTAPFTVGQTASAETLNASKTANNAKYFILVFCADSNRENNLIGKCF